MSCMWKEFLEAWLFHVAVNLYTPQKSERASYQCRKAEGSPRLFSLQSYTWEGCFHGECSLDCIRRWWCCQQNGLGHWSCSRTVARLGLHNVKVQNLGEQYTLLKGNILKHNLRLQNCLFHLSLQIGLRFLLEFLLSYLTLLTFNKHRKLLLELFF